MPISHSLCVQVRLGNSTKKVNILKNTVKPTSPPKLSLTSSKGRITSLYQYLNPLIIMLITLISVPETCCICVNFIDKPHSG